MNQRQLRRRKRRFIRKLIRSGIYILIAAVPLLLIYLIISVIGHAIGDSPEPTPTPTPTPLPSATILATGDILPHLPVVNAAETSDGNYSFDSILAPIIDYVSEADYAVANLETVLCGLEGRGYYSGYPQFNTPDEIAAALDNAGFDMLLTANNHTNDGYELGVTRTLKVIQKHDMDAIGTRLTEDAPKYHIENINGISVGMINYTFAEYDNTTGIPKLNSLKVQESLRERINLFNPQDLDTFYEEMTTNLSDMKADGAEAIVLFIHWGTEYELTENETQAEIAQKMCDLGVDVIVGGHPHTIQPIKTLTSTTDAAHQTLCAYSLGNALSNQHHSKMSLGTAHTEDGMLFSFTFEKDIQGNVTLTGYDVLPTWVHIELGFDADGEEDNTYQILPLDKAISDWKAEWDIDETVLKEAEESFNRTKEIVQ